MSDPRLTLPPLSADQLAALTALVELGARAAVEREGLAACATCAGLHAWLQQAEPAKAARGKRGPAEPAA